MTLPNSSEITNFYLYGTNSTPDLTSASVIRPGQLPSAVSVSVNLNEYMSTGPGRFATGDQFAIVSTFFAGSAFDGMQAGESLSKSEYAQRLGLSFYGLNVYQRLVDDGAGDFAERTYIWNSLQYKISDNAVFKVNLDGTRVIENFSIAPVSNDNFDFSSSDAGIADTVLKSWIDPWSIGHKVTLAFDGAPITQVYDINDYMNDNRISSSWSHPSYQNLYDAMATLSNNLFNIGVTRFLDDQQRVIKYGTSNADQLVGVFDQAWITTITENIFGTGKVGTGQLSLYETYGFRLIGGDGNDILQGSGGRDYLDGGDGDDILVGAGSLGLGPSYTVQQLRTDLQSENLYKTAHSEWSDGARDTLSGGAGNDIYILGGGLRLSTGMTEGQLDEINKLDLIDGGDTDFTVYAQWQNKSDSFITIKMTGGDLVNPRTWGDQLAFDNAVVRYYDPQNDPSRDYLASGYLVGARWFDQSSGEALLLMNGMVASWMSGCLFGVKSYLTFNPGSSDGWNFMGKGSGGAAGTGGASRAMAALADSGVENAEASDAADNDEITTGNGKDYVYARSGDDLIHLGLYGGGDDYVDGGTGSDTADYTGASSNLNISFEAEFNLNTWLSAYWTVTGASIGTDYLLNIERIIGGSGNDSMTGSGGNDTLAGAGGNDVIDGGDGNDTIDFSMHTASVTVLFSSAGAGSATGTQSGNDTFTHIENVTGSQGDDIVTGDSQNNVIYGQGGNDVIRGMLGDDTIFGELGNDIIYGGDGADSLQGGDGDDTIYIDQYDTWYSGDDGNDTLIFTGAGSLSYSLGQGNFENVTTADGNDTIWGTDGANIINLGAGDDTAQGYGGDDIINGGAGADSLMGGDGNDTIYIDKDDTWYSGDNGIDTLIFTGTGSLSYALAQGGFENVTTAAGNDTIWGTDDANIIDLGAGDDSAQGYGGDDIIIGGAGADSLQGGDGNDTIYVDQDDTWYSGDDGIDTIIFTGAGSLTYALAQGGFENATTAAGDDTIWGTDDANVVSLGGGNDVAMTYAGNDVVDGGDGNDFIDGGAGNDNLTGGAGNDTFVFHADFGRDTITDFTAGAGSDDVIQIDTNVFADFAAVMNAASQVGADTVITADASNVITLKNVTLSSLHQDDFSFAVAS